ncbi:hypothetical protein GCM10009745_77440 [Kribbella yunnanensis]|uniref:Aminoglycoside phosphotransferase domain-containing protein n=1 Tax=Kribbella yunnanensis TaxID=190194 RepID=A0ABP4V8Z2_9ACTN
MAADPRLELVAEVNHHMGSGLRLVGIADHGQSGGAAFVEWPDGRPGVVTRSSLPMADLARTAEVLGAARSAGVLVPRHEAFVELTDGVAVVQERLPGRPARRTDVEVIDALLAVTDEFVGLLAERTDVPPPSPHLYESGLEQHSPRSRRLLRRIHELGDYEMTGTDLVHPDFTVPNVLFDDHGQLSGVVDWNLGAFRGDRHWALVKLRFDLAWAAAQPGDEQPDTRPEAIERLDRALETRLEPEVLLAYWAHWTLTQLHWAVLHDDTAVIDLHLELGESRLLEWR